MSLILDSLLCESDFIKFFGSVNVKSANPCQNELIFNALNLCLKSDKNISVKVRGAHYSWAFVFDPFAK